MGRLRSEGEETGVGKAMGQGDGRESPMLGVFSKAIAISMATAFSKTTGFSKATGLLKATVASGGACGFEGSDFKTSLALGDF